MTSRGSRNLQMPGSGPLMGLTYFKRFRMEIDLTRADWSPPPLRAGYLLVPWDRQLLTAHAEAKYASFRSEVDANVFSCLGSYEGCLRLMHELAGRNGFLPAATWLIVRNTLPLGVTSLAFDRHGKYRTLDAGPAGGVRGKLRGDWQVCGTIQGVAERDWGAIQNLGIVPEHRGRGLGSCLMYRALAGFRQAGLRKGVLEVTAQNEGAVRLYRRLGFYKARTLYKAVEVDSLALT